MKTSQVTKLGMFLSIALVLSYLESLLPVMIAIPGMKIGLANIVTMLLLYNTNFRSTFLFMMLRVVLAGFLFSGVSTIIYGFVGGLFCIGIMSLLKHLSFFSILGVSMAGAVFHNIGQIIVAMFVMENVHILYYLPILCVTAVVSGLLIGYITFLLLKHYKMNFKD